MHIHRFGLDHLLKALQGFKHQEENWNVLLTEKGSAITFFCFYYFHYIFLTFVTYFHCWNILSHCFCWTGSICWFIWWILQTNRKTSDVIWHQMIWTEGDETEEEEDEDEEIEEVTDLWSVALRLSLRCVDDHYRGIPQVDQSSASYLSAPPHTHTHWHTWDTHSHTSQVNSPALHRSLWSVCDTSTFGKYSGELA